MALEDAIQNLADAINNHAAVLAQTIGAPAVEQPVKKGVTNVKADTPASATKATGTEASDTKKTSAQDAETQSSSESAQASTAPAKDATSTKSSAEPEPVDVNVLKEKFASLVEANRDAAIAVLTKLGFSKLNLVPANKHAEALQLVQDALLVA